MPSQLLTNDKISFVVSKPFTSRGKTYEVGDDFDQEEARDIEVFVRARYVIPVVDEVTDKPRHWHRHIRPKDEVLARLERGIVQLRMPHEHDSQVDMDLLVHPELTPEPTPGDADAGVQVDEEPDSEPEPEDEPAPEYDPGEHTVNEVLAYIAEHPEQRDAILDAEADGRGRKGVLGDDD